MVSVEILPQKLLQGLLLAQYGSTKSDERWRRAYVFNAARSMQFDIVGGLSSQIHHEGADHAAHGFVHQPPLVELRILAQHLFHMARENINFGKLLDAKQTGAQAVIDVMIIIGDLV